MFIRYSDEMDLTNLYFLALIYLLQGNYSIHKKNLRSLKYFEWEISSNSTNETTQFRISPHRPNVILGIENCIKKGLFP